MYTKQMKRLLAAVVFLGSAAGLTAQQKPGASVDSHLDVAVSYQATYSNPVGGGSNFWLQGGNAQVHGQFWHGWGEVADISGAHASNVNSSGVSLGLVTATFGPRYTQSLSHSRMSLYGQALVGEAFGFDSVFPGASGSSDSANGLALLLGGGMNYAVKHRISARVFEADWLRTQLPNGTTDVQNNLRLSAGVVLHLK